MHSAHLLTSIWVHSLVASQKLRSIIDAHNLPLGTTQNGKDWCIKALHPSDPLTEVSGIPDQSAIPSVFVNYQTVAEITNPNPAAVGTWSADLALIPHPIGFLYANVTDSIGTLASSVLNSQIAGATHSDKWQSWYTQFERWRLAYMSVSIYQDGADLTNQGTCVASQATVKPHYHYKSNLDAGNLCVSSCRLASFTVNDAPDYNKSQSMPNAYFNRSKEGCYMPLKLTETHQRWHSSGKAIQLTSATPTAAGQNISIPAASIDTRYPFPGLFTASQSAAVPPAVLGQATSDFCNDSWGLISFKNLALITKLQVFIRAGYELQVQPGTAMSPYQKLSPSHDELALRTYFAISRELKDAFPVDHNDLGKIWDVISGIAKTVAPALVAIPGIGPVLSTVVGGAASIGDTIRRAVSGADSGRNSGGSMADTQLARAAVVAANAPQVRVPAKQQLKFRPRQLSQKKSADVAEMLQHIRKRYPNLKL